MKKNMELLKNFIIKIKLQVQLEFKEAKQKKSQDYSQKKLKKLFAYYQDINKKLLIRIKMISKKKKFLLVKNF